VKKRNKKYRPKPVIRDTVAFVLSGMRRVADLKEPYLMALLRTRTALERLRTGIADKDDIGRLMAMLNLAEALAVHGLGKDHLDSLVEIQNHLFELATKGVERGYRFTMNAAQWQALKDLVDLHEAQLDACTVYQIEQAVDFIERHQRSGNVRLVATPKGISNEPT